jgi:glycerol-3-phosphate dehydrogenase
VAWSVLWPGTLHGDITFLLQGVTLPESLRASGDMKEVVGAAEIILVVGPLATCGCTL